MSPRQRDLVQTLLPALFAGLLTALGWAVAARSALAVAPLEQRAAVIEARQEATDRSFSEIRDDLAYIRERIDKIAHSRSCP